MAEDAIIIRLIQLELERALEPIYSRLSALEILNGGIKDEIRAEIASAVTVAIEAANVAIDAANDAVEAAADAEAAAEEAGEEHEEIHEETEAVEETAESVEELAEELTEPAADEMPRSRGSLLDRPIFGR